MSVSRYFQHFGKTKPCIFQTIFKSGIDESSWLSSTFHYSFFISIYSEGCFHIWIDERGTWYFSILTNDLVSHDPTWSFIPTKFPLYIPKFKGKSGEDPGENVTTFHLWCSLNSLNHDYVHLWLFQRTLTSHAAKWYIEFPRGTYRMFNDLSMTFLNQFQLPMCHDAGTELLSTF